MRTAYLLVACLLAACGGRAAGSDEPAPTAPTAPTASAPGSDAPPAAATTPSLTGDVSLVSAGGQLHASAIFPLAGSSAPPVLGPECVSRKLGDPSTETAGVSAGKIVIDVTGGPGALTLAYDDAKRVYGDASFDGAVAPDSPIRVHASGGSGVPAFDASIKAAEEAKLSLPAEGATISADSGDLDVTWTPVQEPLLVVSLGVLDTTISCRFGAPSGHGTVPGALIRHAIEGADPGAACAGSCTNLTVFTGRTTKVTAGTYDVFVTHGATASRTLTLVK